ncbi:hypothetical protein OAG1_06950 [Agarivorans sp. OAG1]|uniref:6-carboxytetrahydropterin synthase n=1 Tax=unclassified Agarivorans TaxID=2636026 RepID=UPI002B2DA291|nr:hypothetical protein OAG1_06950 [Agarivorans sp. OAG1]
MNLFVKALTVIDASYLSDKRGMVGESWILDVALSGQLNEMSMVLDFGRVKSKIKNLVDQFLDHRLLVPKRNPQIRSATTKPGYTSVDLMRGDKSLHLNCPDEAYCFINTDEVTIQSVTEHLYLLLRGHLPENIEGLDLTLRTEKIDGAYYHYSHGLKKHDGNCQRIAHGHRSSIELIIDGKRDHVREHAFAKRWEDIYLASLEDKIEIGNLALSQHSNAITDETHCGFSYVSEQGKFELAIAQAETEIIDSDTTVELLANHIANEVLKTLSSAQTLKVVAYEGVGKGAVAHRTM